MTQPGPALLVFAGLTIGLIALLWPRMGIVPRLARLSRLDERVRVEDALKHVFTCQRDGQTCSLESLAGRLEISTTRAAALLSRLAAMGLVHAEGPTLTKEGEQSALRLVRTHRLWERYLADRTGIPASEWHDQAEQMEHTLSPEQADLLASRLGHPPWDPHGDPIPTSLGEMPALQGVGLVAIPSGAIAEVVHLEDEPREIYDTLVKDGLALGSRVEVIERTGRGVRLRAEGREWTLDPVAARNVTVRPLPDGASAESARHNLLDAVLLETVHVEGIAPACRGTQRRRLLDLGIVRGTPITPELVSVGGDPIAYRVRGALIALRREQASWIWVSRDADHSAGSAPSARVA